MTSRGLMQRNLNVSNVYWKTLCFDIKTFELEGPESSKRKTFLMNFITVYLLFVLPLPLTLATGAVSFVSQFDVAYYEKHCRDDFSTGCPVHGDVSWVCSKNITNCTSPDYPYHCILNTARKVVHICAAAQICPRGTDPIFDPRTHMVSCQNCQKGYYQPLQLWSNNTPVCKEKFVCDINYHKIECTVEPEKEPTQDTLCRCDARNDYILSSSEGREICVPGKFSDCYELKCPDGQERLLNYTCAPRCDEGFQRDDSDICVPKSTVITTTEGDKATPTLTASTENVSKGSISGSISVNDVIIVIFVSLGIIFFITVIVLCWKGKICSRIFSPAQSDDPEAGTMSNESCITRLCNWQYRQAQSDDPEARTMSNVLTKEEMEMMPLNNAQTDDPEAGTMSNDTNGNATSRERPNQGTNTNAQPRDIPNRETPSQAQTDDPEAGTMSNEKLHPSVLNRCLPDLMLDLDYDTVEVYIQQKEIFHPIAFNNIKGQRTSNEKKTALIEALNRIPQDKYEEFKKCLAEAGQEHLKNMLEKEEEEVKKEIREKHLRTQ